MFTTFNWYICQSCLFENCTLFTHFIAKKNPHDFCGYRIYHKILGFSRFSENTLLLVNRICHTKSESDFFSYTRNL